MTRKKLSLSILFSFSVILLLLILVISLNQKQDNDFLGVSSSNSSKGIHETKFFNEQLFNKAVLNQNEKYKNVNYHVSGGIIPHDLLPSFIFADFFSKLAKQNPETIIIIGPNHYEKGDYKFLTSYFDWETSLGTLLSDQKILDELVDEKIIGVNEEALLNDHSVGSSLPFIKYYLPDVKIVPILISGFVTQGEADLFSNKLANLVNEKVVLVAAVDFSHYLNRNEAQQKDEITENIIKDYDYSKLFLLNNDYTDSPASLGVFLMTMQKLGKTNMDILENTNSGKLQDRDFIETTSYFYITYH